MQKISVYFKSIPENACEIKNFYVDDWYVKPSILCSIAYYFAEQSDCLFVTCKKYGCRQFLPKKSKSYPILRAYFLGPDMVAQSLVLVFGDR